MFCHACGMHLGANARFCGSCGAPAVIPVPQPQTQQSVQSPERANKAMLFFALYWIVFQLVFGVALLLLGLEDPMVGVVIAQVVGLFVPFVFYLLITKQSPRQVLPWKGLSAKNALLVVALSLAILPAIHLIAHLSSFVFFTMHLTSTAPLWLMVAIVAVLPSLFEEFLFRGMMYTEYRAGGVSIHKIALISGILFGLMHLNFYQAIYASLIGVLYAYVVHYTRSILAPMLGHFINNAIATLLGHQNWYINLLNDLPRFLLIVGIAMVVMVPVIFLCMKQLKKHYNNTQTTESVPVFVPEIAIQKPQAKVFTGALWATLIIFFLMTFANEILLRTMI